MKRKPKEYQRLPGRKRTLSGTSTLWLGTDHLLRVDSHSYAEDYKRFYYRDIQSIVLLPTQRRRSALRIWATISLALLLLSVYLRGDWGIFPGILAAAGALMLARAWLRGPTCECHLQTAVQKEILPSLNRLRTALKAFSALQARIETVQGKLSPEFFQTASPDRSAGFVSPPPQRIFEAPVHASLSSTQAQLLLPHSSGAVHAVLFSLLLFDAAVQAADLAWNHVVLTVAGVLIYLGVAMLVIFALIQQSRADIGHFLRWPVLAGLGYVCVSFILGSVYSLVLSTRNPHSVKSQWDMIFAASKTSAWDSPWLLAMSLFSLVSSLAIAISGWISLVRFWAQPAQLSQHRHGSLGQI